jgi:YfiH family protein
MFRFAKREAIEYLEAEAISELGFVTHAFCTRRGGVSKGPFTSLNAGFLVGDREEDVQQNLALIGETFTIPAGQLVLMKQIHGNRVHVIDKKPGDAENIPECDGLITDRPGLALGIRTADCVPLFFVDTSRKVIGVAHAGWRGTALAIASRMVEALQEGYASRVENILIAIGPAIGACCYQVDGTVYAAFASRKGADHFFQGCQKDDRWMLDLASANRFELLEKGIPEKNIFSAGECTACRQDLFFSHRASLGCTGRHINMMMLREDCRR